MNKLRIAFVSTNDDIIFNPVFENSYLTEKEFEIDEIMSKTNS